MVTKIQKSVRIGNMVHIQIADSRGTVQPLSTLLLPPPSSLLPLSVRSPGSSVSDPEERFWRRGYFFGTTNAPCWLRVTLRAEKTTTSSGPKVVGGLRWAGLESKKTFSNRSLQAALPLPLPPRVLHDL